MQHNVGAKADIVRIEVRVQAFLGKRQKRQFPEIFLYELYKAPLKASNASGSLD